MLKNLLKDYQVHIFVGMFGSGKTEVSMNVALELKKENKNVAIADLDIISPYFRVRDKIEELNRKDIKVIAPPEKYMHADVPIVPGEIGGYITNQDYKTVIDVGGNEDGVKVLGSLKNYIDNAKCALYFVINTRRPFMDTKEYIIKNLQSLENSSRLKINYLVVNSNIQNETTKEIIEEGENIIGEVSNITNIPIAFTVVTRDLEDKINAKFEKFVIQRFFGNYGFC
ncbi:cobalamin biosynthesis protein CobQ [Petrotoga sp. HKA.pet.4.5]|jgi:hypothetical protein|uniref:cobalamin biosynthesis protein CobQ n=1 Tax=unclassified Petrotoga TaxID=2620614 RepID=UPI000EF13BE1|nr:MULTISPECIES: cobalamin biosynthesis protein CobQ [unclassified Petrotoga]MDK2812277.1 hypothetical protein [Petrotoga sp.]RLL85423.1 cobalamin biosynthesis protein CobQ [Petrotoga sp. Shatin.DS.tank11.9.2.9.3]RLL88771.1 cobalamin biosynthesis protein CobQ [Petrotoga sp. HKA.pet.4.5]